MIFTFYSNNRTYNTHKLFIDYISIFQAIQNPSQKMLNLCVDPRFSLTATKYTPTHDSYLCPIFSTASSLSNHKRSSRITATTVPS